MSQPEDNVDAGGAINDIFFDENQHERRSWRFCNSRVPRSELFYFTQIFKVIFLIGVSLLKLVFFKLNCEESTTWISLLSCTVGYALPNPELWIKQFQISIDFYGCLWPIMLSKNWIDINKFASKHLLNQVWTIFYVYQHDQPKFLFIERNINIQFMKFFSFEQISELDDWLWVFENSCEEIINDTDYSKLATAGRH